MTETDTRGTERGGRWWEVYLNDHLAGAAGGVRLARRLAGRLDGDQRRDAQRLAHEIAEDRDRLHSELVAAFSGIPEGVRGADAA